MSDTPTPPTMDGDWSRFFTRMNEEFVDAMEQNFEAQAEFVESWSETVADSTGDETVSDGLRGYARAYEVWMNAAGRMVERANDAAEGEEVDINEFRDVWLNAANDAFKEVMSTTAYAAATGETVEQAMEAQQGADEAAESTLHTLGFATEGDIEEVGGRLVELERRQHAVEEKLDRVLDALETA